MQVLSCAFAAKNSVQSDHFIIIKVMIIIKSDKIIIMMMVESHMSKCINGALLQNTSSLCALCEAPEQSISDKSENIRLSSPNSPAPFFFVSRSRSSLFRVTAKYSGNNLPPHPRIPLMLELLLAQQLLLLVLGLVAGLLFRT